MSEIRKWLESISLGQYADAFDANEIGMDLLQQVDDQMLKDIGVAIGGHRLRIRNAIAKLGGVPAAETNLSPTTPKHETTPAFAERRQLTVMFCDLVGSTALSARLDPEDLRIIISTYHGCCTELVNRNGGFVAKYIGDGVLAYFGYPQAHEHDAERAVCAALNLVEAVPKLAPHAGSPLQVRVGIATGLVVVGDLIGAGSAQEQAVVGETPNLAARLQALAEPSAVVIAAATRRLTGGLFEYRDLGTMALKGFAENVQAWQVLGAGTAESRFEALRATTTALVGREEEIDLLIRRWEQAKRGDGFVVLISGEPGIGKSRIAQAVAERISAEPHTRLRYFCSPHHQDSALYPSIAQLERAAGFRREDTSEQRLAKLEAVLLAQGSDNLSEAIPLLADLLSTPTGDRYTPLDLTPQKRKEKTLHAQLAQVEGLAAQQPVLMVWEDVHWSDPTTRELLDLLIDRVPTLRVLVIITFRPEFAPPWIGRPHVTMLILNRLPDRQRAMMITQVTGGKALPKEMVDQIIDRTDGVPLFIEELTKAVVESGMVVESGDRYIATGPAAPLAIPTSLHASLLARLDRLAPTREVAQIGAALGRSFSHGLISAVAAMPQQKLDDALAQLVRAELIFQRGTPPDAVYTFKHALVQDAAYGTLLRSSRQQLHGRITATLEEQFPHLMDIRPELLARHSAEAGFIEKAVGYWLKAGRLAITRSAMIEASSQLQKGLDILAGLTESHWREQQELEFQVALGPALFATKGFAAPDVSQGIARGLLLARKLDRTDYLVPLLYAQWVSNNARGVLGSALSFAEQMEETGETCKDPAALLLGRLMVGVTRMTLGELGAARDSFEQCEALSVPAHRTVYATLVAEDPHTVMLAMLALTLCCLGYIDQARARISEALRAARQLKHACNLTLPLNYMCRISCIIGSPEDLTHAEEAVSLSREHGFPHRLGEAYLHKGRSLVALGNPQEGIALILKGLSTLRATGTLTWTAYGLAALGEAYSEMGRHVEALNCLTEATGITGTTDRQIESELLRLRGDVLCRVGDHAVAEQEYHQALAVAKRQSAKTSELRAATSLARLWRDQGKRIEARDLLAPVYGWFTEGFDTPVLQDAEALLD
jgi:class 3 adenylate cyclase